MAYYADIIAEQARLISYNDDLETATTAPSSGSGALETVAFDPHRHFKRQFVGSDFGFTGWVGCFPSEKLKINRAHIRVSSCKLFCICSILVIIHIIIKTFVPPKKEETAFCLNIHYFSKLNSSCV